MVNVAVAGGTGKLGLTIAEVISKNPEHKVVVLSRQSATILDGSVPVVAVDYADVKGLERVLQEHAVDTVISALQVATPESGINELNLVAAAASASTPTKRFISSDWGALLLDPATWLPHNVPRAATVGALKKSGLEYTTFFIGQMLDHLGTPHIRSHMGRYCIHFDMENRAATIPGSGDVVSSFTYSYDIARFVEAALGLPRWEPEMFCYSDQKTYKEVLALAEAARGSLFAVSHDSEEQLEKGDFSVLPFHATWYDRLPKAALQRRYAAFALYVMRGQMLVPEERSLNKLFPEIKTMTVAEAVGAWRGKE